VHAEPYKEAPEPEFIRECKKQGMSYVSQPAVEGFRLHWLCSDCFQEFREALHFELK
jgi:hypothetical protein